ncbi:uncharacterized protein LOC125012104 [Mugil cephalus]|uniref:uncharacterized protein LOC125012104 n=1 Tax=Mugil cephalus TaxID=48193 RepID=UPI001FB7B130|nr:uncharacterized protein LOC125012104 [Mugil cephalus]
MRHFNPPSCNAPGKAKWHAPISHTLTHTQGTQTHSHTHTVTLTKADMTEPSRSIFYLPIIYLWTGGVEGNVLASLGPPVHLSGERLGWTLLVCMVSDFRRGHLEVSWRSASEGYVSSVPYRHHVSRKHRGQNAVAIITVATRDWPSYGCSVGRRQRAKVKGRRHTTSSGNEDKMCHEVEETGDIRVRTNAVVVLALRLILIKILAYNTLMTIYVVIK